MTKKHFIALADRIKDANRTAENDSTMKGYRFSLQNINVLADFCQSQNPRFNRKRWLAYIAGECGPNGGKVTR
jgi:hypothetical protein